MIDSRKRQLTATIGVIVATVVALVLYRYVNPSEAQWMPRCMFYSLFGYQCPGCGLQRAAHAVLHGDFAAAWAYNPFLFFIAPVGLAYVIVEISGRQQPRLRRLMFSPLALWSLIAATVIWWIVRNLYPTE